MTPRTTPVLASTRVRVTPSDPSATTDQTRAAFGPPRTDRVAPWTWIGSATLVFAPVGGAGAAATCRASAVTRAEVVLTAAAALTSGVVAKVVGTATLPSSMLTAAVVRAVWTA